MTSKNLSLSQKFIMNTMQETRKPVVINRRTNWNKFQVYMSLVKRGLLSLMEQRGDDHIFALAQEPAVVSVPDAPAIPPAAKADEGVSIVTDCQHCRFRAATQVIDDLPYCDECASNIKVQIKIEPEAKPKREKKAKVSKTADKPAPEVTTTSGENTLIIMTKEGDSLSLSVDFDKLLPKYALKIAEERFANSASVKMILAGAPFGYDVRFSEQRQAKRAWQFFPKAAMPTK
jgi:hypothetical protein